MSRFHRASLVFSTVLFLGAGCGGPEGPPEATKGNTVQAGADRRVKFKDEYKKMIGPDGKMKSLNSMPKPQ